MIDAHCHLNFHAFRSDYDKVIKTAIKAGVEKIINVGTSVESSKSSLELSEKYENLYSIVGIHPHHADKLEKGWEKEIDLLSKKPKVLAIGEIGMDYFGYKSNGIVDKKLQREVFETQIEIAYKNKLPLQVHGRHAAKDIIEILEKNKNKLMNNPGMFHCMSGNLDYLKKALNLGFYIGFDGNITYKGLAPGEDTLLSDLVGYTPLDKIILETDSPFLTPVPYRGSRNQPCYVIIVGEFISKIKRTSYQKVNDITTGNANRIFRL
jgi:TatD DNase family protein